MYYTWHGHIGCHKGIEQDLASIGQGTRNYASVQHKPAPLKHVDGTWLVEQLTLEPPRMAAAREVVGHIWNSARYGAEMPWNWVTIIKDIFFEYEVAREAVYTVYGMNRLIIGYTCLEAKLTHGNIGVRFGNTIRGCCTMATTSGSLLIEESGICKGIGCEHGYVRDTNG